jgi:FKBP-type peptidyl-prolyl cis-trans isomerase
VRSPASLLTALLLALALLATACGGSDDNLTTEELLAEPDDAAADSDGDSGSDATSDAVANPDKPTVDDEYLVDVNELIVTDLVEGTGDEAVNGSIVSLQYVGVLAADGSQFDASWDRGATPITVNLGAGQVIPGWDQGIVGMKLGGRRVLQIPAAMAYGESAPSPAIPANSDLVFIVDLVDLQPPPPPTPTPEPSPPIPEDALGTFDELGIIDLAEGDGREIQPGDIVAVQYVGVTADEGVEFDSSWARGGAPFRLIAGASGVIEGWQEGVLGAQVGTERILQIPSDQAYGEGDLVFRIHVEEITEAPLAHTLTFGGETPADTEMTVLVEGSGDGAVEGDVVNARVVVIRHSDSDILQSSYQDDAVTPMFISPEGLLPGLNDAMLGIKPGELRQVILPVAVAFPDGAPQDLGLGADDAFVFVIDAESIDQLDG